MFFQMFILIARMIEVKTKTGPPLYCADIVMEMHIVTMNDKHDDDNADHSMTTINRSREISTM